MSSTQVPQRWNMHHFYQITALIPHLVVHVKLKPKFLERPCPLLLAGACETYGYIQMTCKLSHAQFCTPMAHSTTSTTWQNLQANIRREEQVLLVPKLEGHSTMRTAPPCTSQAIIPFAGSSDGATIPVCSQRWLFTPKRWLVTYQVLGHLHRQDMDT